MADKIEIAQLIEYSTYCILKDLKHIKEQVEAAKLDHDTAQDLARYHTVLVDKKFNEVKELESDRKKISQLSTEELIEKAEKDIERIKNNKKKVKEKSK